MDVCIEFQASVACGKHVSQRIREESERRHVLELSLMQNSFVQRISVHSVVFLLSCFPFTEFVVKTVSLLSLMYFKTNILYAVNSVSFKCQLAGGSHLED